MVIQLMTDGYLLNFNKDKGRYISAYCFHCSDKPSAKRVLDQYGVDEYNLLDLRTKEKVRI